GLQGEPGPAGPMGPQGPPGKDGGDSTNVTALQEEVARLQELEENNELIGRIRKKVPIVSFEDDDATAHFPEAWDALIKEKKIPVAIAVPTERIGTTGFMTWDQLKYYQSLGCVCISHGLTHTRMTSLTLSEAEHEMSKSKDDLLSRGFSGDVFTYPFSDHNLEVRNLARKYFRGCMAFISQTAAEIPIAPIDNHLIRVFNHTNDVGGYTLQQLKDLVDEAVKKKGWLIFVGHSQNTSFTDAHKQTIRDLVDYIRSQNVDILSIPDALDIYGNMVDIGDIQELNRFAIGCDGSVFSRNGGGMEIKDSRTFLTTPQEYPPNSCTITPISPSNPTVAQFPRNRAGLLITYSPPQNIANPYRQLYYPYSTTGVIEVWSRMANMDNTEWASWFKPTTTLSGTGASKPIESDVGTVYFDTGINKPVFCKTAGSRSIDRMTITHGADTSGNIKVATHGSTVTVAVVAGDSAAQVAAKIAAIANVGSNKVAVGNMVYVLRQIAVDSVNPPTLTETGGTGVTATVVRIIQPAASEWVDATGTAV
ncbi:MAG: polysaccharide deacetylase family protein, partial [Firmicutes bacterium]|nr:polysaccharide deacetylase family protein [Bacillota bacterium]